MKTQWILPLQSEQTGLAEIGGKAANLAHLACAGFPVPGGFVVTTRAYRDFVTDNHLETHIRAVLAGVSGFEAEGLETASHSIRAAFTSGRISPQLVSELVGAYRSIGCPAVAVRSSATAEDLPDMSFAGQQDTYLNVCGEDALLQAIVSCWSSLWTTRAIGYRNRNGVPHDSTALAVVVQRMVESQVSGVLFTANPLTGQRFETVIDAAFGLGEALVSGRVEPDQYIVDMRLEKMIKKNLGAKALSLHGYAGGGVRQHDEARQEQQALPDPFILKLAQMGQQAAEYFGSPQDIEWAWADEKLYLLQSRPITSLYPTPEGIPPQPLRVFFSFGAVQGMLDPITPLGRDSMLFLFTTAARLFGIHYARFQDCTWKTGGERLWVDITTVVRNSIGRRLLYSALGLVEPTIQQGLGRVWEEPDLMPTRRGLRPKALLQIMRFYLPLMRSVIANLSAPERRRHQIIQRGEQILTKVRAACAGLNGTPHQKLAQVRAIVKGIEQDLPVVLREDVSLVASGQITYHIVRLIAKRLETRPGQTPAGELVLRLTRGLPNNPTTQMDLNLWQVAHTIQGNPALLAEFTGSDAHVLSQRWLAGELLPAGQELVGTFMERYGGRGMAEIDLGRPRWQEDPAHIFEVLSSYLQIDRPDAAPDVVFAKGEISAREALEELCKRLKGTSGGWLRVRVVRFFARRMRILMGGREEPKFFIVRLLSVLRWSLLKIGAEMVQAGELTQPDDVMYTTWDEIDACANGSQPFDRGEINQRRERYQRELLRRQIPRLLLSDGRAFYEGLASTGAGGNGLHGSPVSPGRVEGRVRVVLDPRRAKLKPGEILVCPGTDPSWTPLFLSAGGLIMEVGGLMTHGAVVAREYGIPAVVGVDQATTRLKTGQFIRMDGSSGSIEIMEESG